MPRSPELDFSATIRGFAPGQKSFGRFTLIRLLGRGGMGVVWLARDETLEREVALKFLPEAVSLDPRSVDDLKRETRRSLDLTHPHIVRIHDFYEDPNGAAISMEYVDGGTLARLAVEQPIRCFEPEQLLPWLCQLADALDYAHQKAKIVHRDLKPSNLMVNGDGDLKVTDFGISATVTDSVTRVSRLSSTGATPAYASPQQVMGERASPADDIYSLGATIYDLLAGKPPFHSGNLLIQVQEKTPPSIAERRRELEIVGRPVPESWEKAIASCLAKDPARRPPSAGALLAALDNGRTARADGPVVVSAHSSTGDAAVEPGVMHDGHARPASEPAQPEPKPESEPEPKPASALAAFAGRLRGAKGPRRQAFGIGALVLAVAAIVLVILFARRPGEGSGEAQVVHRPQAEGGVSPAAPASRREVSNTGASSPATAGGAAVAGPREASAGRDGPGATGGSAANTWNTSAGRNTSGSAAPSSASRPTPPATGSVEIRSDPAGAIVVSEGRELGRTPLVLSNQRPGRVSFLLRSAGHQEAEIAGDVRAGEVTQFTVPLRPLAATSSPAEAAPSSRNFVIPDLELAMIWIEPGSFDLGSPVSESGAGSDERPVTRVSLSSGFWIGRTEVTQAQYQALAGRNPSYYKSAGPSAPVEQVSWQDAKEFCARLTDRERSAGRLPQGFVYDLPTEAQWEFACRAGTPGPYAGPVEAMAWAGRSASSPRPVAGRQPNAWGLYDMHGNVAEWTASWYGEYPGGTQVDYAGPGSGRVRVFRGGAYNSPSRMLRSAYRNWVSPRDRDRNRGFRVALVRAP